MSSTPAPDPPWWTATAPGTLVELGFVKIDRVGSTEEWSRLPANEVIQRRAQYIELVETLAIGFSVVQPIHWQGDGAMLFVGPSQVAAAIQAFELGVMLQKHMAVSGFGVRLAVHCGRVPFARDAGNLASPEIDRAGHLESACPPGALALSEDIFLGLPGERSDSCGYLGTTERDGTVAFVYPGAAAAHKDAPRFVAETSDPGLARARWFQSVRSPDITRLRYVGFRLTRKEPPSLALLDVFTPLHVREHRTVSLPDDDPRGLRYGGRGDESGLQRGFSERPWSPAHESVAAVRPFTEVFRERRHLVVLGDPGAGKSTLLRWLALVSASGRRACREQLGVDERLLPVLVSVGRLFELREASASGAAPSVPDVMALYFRERSVTYTEKWLECCLEVGECLVLLDGLDEVPSDRRYEVVRWLETFASVYRKNRIVATSRVAGFTGFDLPGGAVVDVQPFTRDQVHGYLQAWFRAYRAWEASLTPEAAKRDLPQADAEAHRLVEVLEGDERLGVLTQNPLFLSALALVHRAEGQLPGHRVQLYGILARTLCETWGRARRLTAGTSSLAPRIVYETEAIPVLGYLAFALHQHHGSGVAGQLEVQAWLAQGLVQEAGVPSGEAMASAEQFLKRAGEELQIIAERGPGCYGFLHQTFQEFFAAQYLLAKESFEVEARNRWLDPRWEEVILLGVSSVALLQGRPGAAGAFVESMLAWELPAHPWVTTTLQRHVILAAKCCAGAPNLSPEVYERVLDEFVPLLMGRGILSVTGEQAFAALERIRGSRLTRSLASRLIGALSTSDSSVRWNAASALGDLGDARAVEPLVAALRDPDENVRRIAATALGKLGDARAVEPLVAALRDDPQEEVRSRAAMALSELKDARSVESLLAALRDDPAANVRMHAAMALGELKDARSVESLLAALREDPQETVRYFAASALGRLGDVRAVESLLAALREDPEWEIRCTAAMALDKFKDAGAVEPLLAALRDDPAAYVRGIAAMALGELNDARAVEPLLAALREDPMVKVRISAASALGELKDARAVEPLLVALCEDPQEEVRSRAAMALGELKDARAVEPLLAALREDPAAYVRSRAAVALGELKDARAVEPLLAALCGDPAANVRSRAAGALDGLGDPRAIQPLVVALSQDLDEDVRDAAAWALWSLSEQLVMFR